MADFDCIVIGAGIGGLVSAGRLASKGFKTLLIDKNSTPGGYLQSFKRKGVTFDSSIDCFSGLDANGPITRVLEALGVKDEIVPITIDPIRRSVFPSMTIDVHADIERYIEDLKSLFGSERGGIDSFFSKLTGLYSEIKAWGEFITGTRPDELIPERLISASRLTYKDLLDAHIKDERLKAVLSDRCPFYNLPASRASAIAMAALVMSYFDSGAYRVKGGSQRLAEALVKGIRAKGSEVLMNTSATKILTEGNRAVGIETSNNGRYTGRAVISAIDFHTTFGRLLSGTESSKGALGQRLPDVSSSFFILYAAFKGDIGPHGKASSIGWYPSFDMEANFSHDAPFSERGSIGITIPTITDASMAPAGIHSITAHEMCEVSFSADWKRDKKTLTEKVLKKVEAIIPGITRDPVHIESATPATLERYTNNLSGAAYGWEQAPGIRPLRTYLNGLYLAGHWEGTGGGILASAYSGHKAASKVEKDLG
ncbi:MAG: NAD(P)/FAD-dependent oxidoreductase [Deltaproteobacteria bacterium]